MNLGIENEYQEFKESLSQLKKGLKSLTAMLNRHYHGCVYFGVNDNGDVIGLDIGKNTLEDIRNEASNLIKPKVLINCKILSDGDKKYIKVCASGNNVPYSFDGRYFNRVVSSDEQADTYTLRNMLSSGINDIIVEAESPVKELSFKQTCSFLISKGNHVIDNENFYQSEGFYTRDGSFNLMAYLLSDQNRVSIKVVEFEGKDKTSMSKRTEYGYKSLLLSANEVQEYFKSINATKVILENGTRKEIPLFNFDAFHEAWINACVHNEWIGMIPPSVYIYENRIEIVSYGSLPYNLSLNNFFKGTSVPINNRLLSIFISADFSEQTGHGVPKIVEYYGEKAFNIENGIIIVTLPFNYESDKSLINKTALKYLDSINDNQKKALEYLKDHPFAKLNELSSYLNLSLGGVKKMVSTLINKKLLTRVGPKRKSQWIVSSLFEDNKK